MDLVDASRMAIGLKPKNSSIDSQVTPTATDHKHSSEDKTTTSVDASMGPKGGDSRFDLGDKNDSFMGKNQVEAFAGLTNTSAVERGGRAIDSSALDPVGIEPAMNPPLATPIDIDKQGINSLYS